MEAGQHLKGPRLDTGSKVGSLLVTYPTWLEPNLCTLTNTRCPSLAETDTRSYALMDFGASLMGPYAKVIFLVLLAFRITHRVER